MLWTNIKRVARYGFSGFFRNGFVSLAAVSMLTITLFVLAGLLLANAALSATLDILSEKVDVNVYFVPEAEEEKVLAVRDALSKRSEVLSVEYVSREDALQNFRARHQNDELTIQALEELEDNPLGASLAVRANDPSQYASIAQFLQDLPAAGEGEERIIEKINFFQNQTAIERLTSIINTSKSLSLSISIILGIASVLIAFNTIRLAIYTTRDEIEVMKLVGAGPWYVRGPFLVAGALYGAISGVIVLAVMYAIALSLAGPSERFFGSFNTFDYYTGEFIFIFFVIMGIGILIGLLSSYMAVHRYLKY